MIGLERRVEVVMKELDIPSERFMTKEFPESMYDELCKTLTEFETAPTDEFDSGWLSDGEWLDVFYNLCVRLQNSVLQ